MIETIMRDLIQEEGYCITSDFAPDLLAQIAALHPDPLIVDVGEQAERGRLGTERITTGRGQYGRKVCRF